MKILIIGASGRTGILTVFQALDKGHEVTAFSRTPEKVTIRNKNLTVIQGNVIEYDKVRSAVEGHDVVISTVGVPSRKYSTVLSEGTANIVKAMQETGVRRFICMSSAGVLGYDGGFFFGRIIMPLFMRQEFLDKRRQIEIVQKSGLDWIIIRPTALTDSPKTGKYIITDDIPAGKSVPRADVADFMLKLLTDRQYDHKMPAISCK